MPRPLAGGDPSESESAKARAKELLGRTISERYRVVELVAMGAMGAVYKGEHLLMRKHVAIKVLHPEIEDFPELVARFEREAIAGAHISHPNVASASDFGRFDDESYFLILEFIEGQTLSKLLKGGPVDPLRTAKILKQLALALGAAHERGVVHRDVKPNNVMILPGATPDDDETVKLIDFGLAKVPVDKLSDVARDPTTDGKELTNAGVVMGTVAYMAPETAYGMRSVTARADFYAIGVIAYEMLSGMPLFDETEPQKLFAAHSGKKPQPIAERNPEVKVPADLERVVMRLLEKDPANRFPDAESLVAALNAFTMRVAVEGTVSMKRPTLTGDSSGPTSSRGSGGHYVPRRSLATRRPIPWTAVAIVTSALLLALVYVLTRAKTPEPAKTPDPATTSADAAHPTTNAIAPSTAPGPSASAVADSVRAAASADPAAATSLFMSALTKDSSVLKDHDVAALAVQAAKNVADADTPESAALFDQLALKAGDAGRDVLFAVASSPDMPKATQKARAELDRPDVMGTSSASLRIAYDLLKADCKKREFLFARAANEGDEKALAILTSMMPPACDPKASACCFSRHGELERAIATIHGRAAQP